jgi:hypothetical protein
LNLLPVIPTREDEAMRPSNLLAAACAALLMGCAADDPLRGGPTAPEQPNLAAAQAAIDISGTWEYIEESFLVVRPEGEVLHVTCLSAEGVLTIVQDGATFTGTLVHPTSTCHTKEGVVIPPPWPLPHEAVLSGRITGRAIHIDQYDAPPNPPVHCPKNGTISVTDGTAVELTTTGRCDLSVLPFSPAMAKNSGIATRP